MRFVLLLCLVAAVASQDPTTGEALKAPNYTNLGCYRDTGERDLPLKAEVKATDVYRCRDVCRKLKYRYAGIQAASYCFCGNRYGRYGKSANTKCASKCAANKEQICGGGWHNSVYATGLTVEQASLKTLGCFIDTGNRDLPFHSAGTTDVNSCVKRCGNLGYKYAGLQAGAYCFCGKSYGKHGKALDADCATPCSVNKKQICGGTWRNLIYETEYTPSKRTYIGCYIDSGARDLPEHTRGVMSIQYCLNYCIKRGYKYFGLQYSSHCFCGNTYGRYGKGTEASCRMACNGKKDEICGAGWRNSVYATGIESMEFTSLGCYIDKGTRDLPWLAKSGAVNLNNCRYKCAAYGYLYFGVQNSNQCFCGNSYGRYGKGADSSCNKACVGDKDQKCGGYYFNSIYRTNVKAHHSAQEGSNHLERSLEQSVNSDRTEMRYFGCFKDAGERDLPQRGFLGTVDVHYCRWVCRGLRYRYFGLQSTSCFCGNHFGKYGQGAEGSCSIKCSANKNQMCGGGWYNNLYASGITVEEAKLTPLGCYVDKGDRDLPILSFSGSTVSINSCVKTCRDLGFKYAGTQAASYCFCGDKYGRYGKATDSDCHSRCSGNRRQICGGGWRNSVYATHADISVPSTLGCYKDQAVRDLTERPMVGKMSINRCRKLCRELGYKYAGVQYSNQCWCGNSYGRYGKVAESYCNLKCTGHKDQICGGALYNHIYESGKPEFVFKSFGCFNDKSVRDLPFLAKTGAITLNNCRQACWRYGYKYFGVQNSNHCFCGDKYNRYGQVEDVRCQKPCQGNKEQTCGDAWLNNIYATGIGSKAPVTQAPEVPSTEAPTTKAPEVIEGGGDNEISIEEETAPDSGVTEVGCYNNNENDRDLPDLVFTGSVTIQMCAKMCAERFYKYAALQAGVQCFCGDSYGKHGASTECNLRCRGNAQQICGGKSSITVYTTSVAWRLTSKGCFVDKPARDLTRLAISGAISVNLCFKHCQDLGYYYAGVQNSAQCFCGNRYNLYGRADETQCNMKCRGNKAQICGGAWRNNVYRTNFKATSRTAIGCYKDSTDRDLPDLVETGLMTVDLCINKCSELGYKYAGLQGGNACYCGDSYGRYGKGDSTVCTKACTGNNKQMCGGAGYNLIFDTSVAVNIQSLGCYVDQTKRDLPFWALKGAKVNVNRCWKTCRLYGFLYFGVQNGDECRCGNKYGAYGKSSNTDDCNMKCSGNKAQTCGGSFAQNIYATGLHSESVIISQGISTSTTISGDKDEIIGGNITSIGSRSSGNETSIEYMWSIITYTDLLPLSFGCYKDAANRDLPVKAASAGDMTVKSCVMMCEKKGFAFAGLQNSIECWCGNQFGRYGPLSSDKCNKACGGQSEVMCGGDWANTIFSTSIGELQTIVYNYMPKTIVHTITTITYYDENGNPISSSTSTSTEEHPYYYK
uniref:WSC domain-containing protein n=1 Tax=Macrostomum lignano TaxID=282301 RepID=A0A1I8HTR8_9PLAT